MITDFRQAFDNLRAQATRTLLTAMGIVFGVGSVIGMLSIGAGAREESLRFIEQLGVRNVLIDSRSVTSEEELQQRRRASPGLTERDARILAANVDGLEAISARRTMHPASVVPKSAKGNCSASNRRSCRFTICAWRRAASLARSRTPPAPLCVSWAPAAK